MDIIELHTNNMKHTHAQLYRVSQKKTKETVSHSQATYECPQKKFSPFGSVVWPGIGNKFTNVLFQCMLLKK